MFEKLPVRSVLKEVKVQWKYVAACYDKYTSRVVETWRELEREGRERRGEKREGMGKRGSGEGRGKGGYNQTTHTHLSLSLL